VGKSPNKNGCKKTAKNVPASSSDIQKTPAQEINPYLQAEIDRDSIKSLPVNGSWIPRFLASLRLGWPPTAAAKSAFVSRSAAYDYAKKNPEFERAWIKAEKDGLEHMETVLKKRAETSSDYALLAYLKARDDRYRERVHFEIVRKYIGDFAVQVTHILRNTIPETCPHCKTNLGLSLKVAEALRELSAQVGEK